MKLTAIALAAGLSGVFVAPETIPPEVLDAMQDRWAIWDDDTNTVWKDFADQAVENFVVADAAKYEADDFTGIPVCGQVAKGWSVAIRGAERVALFHGFRTYPEQASDYYMRAYKSVGCGSEEPTG